MRHSLLLLFILSLTFNLQAQPYVDPLNIRYTHAFRNDGAFATPHEHLYIGSDLPLKLKENTYLLLSPYFEQWRIDSADKKELFPKMKSLSLPVGLMLPLNKKWSLTLMGILRTNGEKLFGDHSTQTGGTVFASYAARPDKKFRFGVYVNTEFFGFFVMPLIGTDWRIDKKNYVFGLLPGRLTWEHQWTSKLYGGLTFRSITSSFRLSDGRFVRLGDNQLSAFLDFYPAKRFCLTLEPGFGILRKIKTGLIKNHYLSEDNWGDGAFIRVSGSWRIRL